jgi:hypothetical protein
LGETEVARGCQPQHYLAECYDSCHILLYNRGQN